MPVLDGGKLGWIHAYITLPNDHAEIFHGGSIEGTFRDLEREAMFLKAGKDMTSAMVVQCEVILGVYPQVVHIDLEPSFGDHIGENVVHERLESGRGVAEPKKHYGGFKETKRGDECHFPLIFLSDADIVITPSNIEFGEQCGVLHVIDQLRDEGERISVANSVGVEISIILTRSQSSVLLRYEEKRRGLWGLQGYNTSRLQVFINECPAGVLFCRVERVYFSNFRNEGVLEFNGMVERAMWREYVVGLFGKDIGKG